MNEQGIRAKALEIDLLIGNPKEVKASKDETLGFSPEFWTLILAVEKYLSAPVEDYQTPPV